MLKELRLENYTLAKKIELTFNSGLTIITGESGAGKSVIIGSIELLLGGKASTDIIRFGEKKAVIEAVFDVRANPIINERLQLINIDIFDDLIIRREIAANGQSRIFLNDTPCSRQDLESVTEALIDLHGQHDHQYLLRETEHLSFLDALLENKLALLEYGKVHKNLMQMLKAYDVLKEKIAHSETRKKMLAEHLDDILAANISEEDETQLKLEEKQLLSAEEILRAAAISEELLNNSEQSIALALIECRKQFEYLAQFDKDYAELLVEIKSVQNTINEAFYTVQKTQSNTQLNPDRLGKIQERLYLYEKLKRKYGKDVNEILLYAKNCDKELQASENFQKDLLDLEFSIKKELQALKDTGAILTNERVKASKRLIAEIKQYFMRLGMESAELDINFKDVESKIKIDQAYVAFNAKGFETIEFYVKTNKGSPFLALAKSASGGELSRIMLALKAILAERDHVSVLVFDEIDSGISGAIAASVGKELQDLAKFRQVLCITHSPQIAAKGATHLHVEKNELTDSTVTQISELNLEQKRRRIASLISAGDITETSLKLADELINTAVS